MNNGDGALGGTGLTKQKKRHPRPKGDSRATPGRRRRMCNSKSRTRTLSGSIRTSITTKRKKIQKTLTGKSLTQKKRR